MTVLALMERMNAENQAGTLDWRKTREEIDVEHEAATTSRDREACLSLHKTLMDAVERTIEPDKLEDFKKLRSQDFNRLLIREAVIGRTDGLIEPAIIHAITKREVAAGRLSPDDEFHKLAEAGDRVLTRPPPSEGLASKFRRWLHASLPGGS